MAKELINENRKLRRIHSNIIKEINSLKNIDLLRQKSIWEEKMKVINDMVDKEIKTRNFDFCKLWLKNINEELYKALEYQYRLGLENLNENLPEIQTDLVLRNRSIEFNPSFDFLKQKYFIEIQKFISFPLKFSGVGGQGLKSDLFK